MGAQIVGSRVIESKGIMIQNLILSSTRMILITKNSLVLKCHGVFATQVRVQSVRL